MELRQLMIFREVARQLNFTRTAATLNYTQSNVTSQIQALEARLGTPLFDRLGKTVVLSSAGERLLPYAERILDLAAAAEADVTNAGMSGVLAIGAAETILSYRLPPIVRRFQQLFPNVELSFRPSPCSELAEQLRQGHVHLAFLFEVPQSPQLVTESLIDEELVLVGKPDHPAAAKPDASVGDLAREVLLLTDRGCPYRRILERLLEQAGVRSAGTLEFSSLEAIKRCAAMGVGVALLPRIVVEAELGENRLVELPMFRSEATVTTFVAWHRDKWPSPALQSFLALATEALGSTRAPAALG